jgi:murein L,D-transpeptidase YafK
MKHVTFLTLLLLPGMLVAAGDSLPGYVLQLPKSVKTILVAETDTAMLHRYVADDAGIFTNETWRMSIGQKGAGKQKSGDRRTPLGVYFVVEQLDTTKMHEKYGPAAYPLDYPNAWDAANKRTGHGIWIHGVTPGGGTRPERDTDGCIALPNDKLLILQPSLMPLQTPVIVTRRIRTVDQADLDATRLELLAALDAWSISYREGNWYKYVSLYMETFVYRGMNRDEWSAYRIQTVGDRQIEDFSIDDILLVADPEDEGLYLSRFRQRIRESDRSIATTKRLYWRKNEQGEFKIVAEDNG